MRSPRINCIYLDWGAGGKCNKLPKFLKYFRRNCPEIYNSTPLSCKLHEEYSSFNPTSPLVPPPCRKYNSYGSILIRTKESKQALYEWRCQLNSLSICTQIKQRIRL
jgi:hypothetical protein